MRADNLMLSLLQRLLNLNKLQKNQKNNMEQYHRSKHNNNRKRKNIEQYDQTKYNDNKKIIFSNTIILLLLTNTAINNLISYQQ